MNTADVHPCEPSFMPAKNFSQTATSVVYNNQECDRTFISREIKIGPEKSKKIIEWVQMIYPSRPGHREALLRDSFSLDLNSPDLWYNCPSIYPLSDHSANVLFIVFSKAQAEIQEEM